MAALWLFLTVSYLLIALVPSHDAKALEAPVHSADTMLALPEALNLKNVSLDALTTKLQKEQRHLAAQFGLNPLNTSIADLVHALNSNDTIPGANVTAVRQARQFFGNGGFGNGNGNSLLLALLLSDRDRGYGWDRGYGRYGDGGGGGGGSGNMNNLAQSALLALLGLALIGRMPTAG
ncbi:hypothetical protein BV898_14951 [Hypsibius exemplaris]|uniref:Uncharacterized protein n=1 Tax=Hypsibius exemplaris TaxID=2072580 RepID=A0A9X6RJY9_HYPEX|nr:hypothetical protein BV898_14951 [Hypsibius exemplaris]